MKGDFRVFHQMLIKKTIDSLFDVPLPIVGMRLKCMTHGHDPGRKNESPCLFGSSGHSFSWDQHHQGYAGPAPPAVVVGCWETLRTRGSPGE